MVVYITHKFIEAGAVPKWYRSLQVKNRMTSFISKNEQRVNHQLPRIVFVPGSCYHVN